ncbi:DUF5304 domain-containing protein [Streptomyces sp. NPDC051567]|uniref:DUF5304 domain-containing protein n=1 Tax=Streptomyces sp. NPDC051567 TaxID=3365660 RepID=UPI0037B76984
MSEATDRPTDDDAWAKACAEDLAAERERLRREPGAEETGTAAQELFRLLDAVTDKVSALNSPFLGAAAQGAVRHFADQAKAVAKPVVERNPEVFDHLAAAGSELLAAYRSAVGGHESRWTRDRPPAAGQEPPSGPGRTAHGEGPGGQPHEGPDEGPDGGPAGRIDLD